MRRQPLVLLLVTLAIIAIANVASELGKPVSRALSDGERDGRSARPSHNKEEERMGAETTATWAEHLFKMLRLHKVNRLFERRRFRLWGQFMKLFHRENPEKAMLLTLNSVYDDDERVAMLILHAKRVSKTKRLATKLQEEQLELWKSQNKSPDDVFAWLQLNKENPKDLAPLVSNPEFDTWMEYLNLITEKPEEVNDQMVETVFAHYNDQELAQIIRALTDKEHLKKMKAVDQEKMKNMAHVLQLPLWQTTRKSPDDVFELLELGKLVGDEDQDLSALFKSPQFNTWMEYFQLISEPEDVNKRMVQTLTARYNDQDLAQLLLRSKYKHGDLSSMKQLAADLQVTQLRLWLDKGVTPETASSWLVPAGERLEEAEETLLKTYRKDYEQSMAGNNL
ncbi:hypothetical protein PsorP6_015598 [Peronosclerospora sorghi]|uniref:Uncharacterized protein n=1 Tax=Peronosclerospora sorghi TaxID=230839 RepID=A0ACC0WPU9_9STRA|nr:hypothetical protein PsorP6_015598 [Peronosclerospora sorghi]